jgi:molybdate transport system ATP-binding protein
VTVVRQSAPVLTEVSWTIRSGEHWSVTGPNGSGKSTLLRLILGELHPYPGGRVTRFGSREPLPIWKLKTRIGFFSPELQSRHTRLQTVLDTVVSGLYGHEGLHKPPEAPEIHLARSLLSRHDLDHLEQRYVQRLSHGQQRLVFLLRAMINRPSILLLDEPCSGLDTSNRIRVLEAVELLAREQTHVVLVSHTPEDRIPSINRILRLENGRVIEEPSNEASGSQSGIKLSDPLLHKRS